MKTALLLTNSADTQRLLTDILGQSTNLVLLPLPAEPGREKYDALFGTWLRLADAVIVDAASVGEATRWAIESLGSVRLDEHQAIVVRATTAQQRLYEIPQGWMIVSDKDSHEQLRQSLGTFFELRDAQAKLKRAQAVITRQRQATGLPRPAGPAGTHTTTLSPSSEAPRFRDALKNLSRALAQHQDEPTLLREFLRLLRDLLGAGRLVIFARRFDTDLLSALSGPVGNQLEAVSSAGIAKHVLDNLQFSMEEGIGGYLAREGKILRRAVHADSQALDYDEKVAREFELLGTETAVPILDNDQLLGALSFSGRITGEPVTNEELELVYHLMTQLAQAIRNIRLAGQVAGQQRFLSEVLAHVQSGVVIVGEDGRILSVNQRARQFMDLGRQELLGSNATRLPGLVADVLFEALHTRTEIRQREFVLPRSNRPLSVSAITFVTDITSGLSNRETLVAVGVLEDLTEVKRQQAQARQLADREFFTRLAFRMSHELKNSLVSIKIFAQLLPERYNEKEFREQFSSVVSSEVNRVDVLVNNLTFFAHPLELVYEELVLSDLVENCLDNVAHEFARKKIAYVIGMGEKPPESAASVPVITAKKNFGHKFARLEGDKIRLMQALEHLLRNAVQSMPEGGRLLISTADAQPADFADGKLPEGGGVRIEVRDTGQGISLDNLKRVTEPFITTRNVGVGLGLTIVKKIIERHHGRLQIDSMLGRGTTITLVVPVMTQAHSDEAANAGESNGTAGTEKFAGEAHGSLQDRLTQKQGTEKGRGAEG